MSDRRPGGSVRAKVRVLDGDVDVIRRDDLATEEPLEIRLAAGSDRQTVNVTMRTPGHDFELVAGWLLAEGVIATADDLARVDYCTDVDVAEHQQYNVVTATLRRPELPDLGALERHSYTSSACGVCGKASIDAVASRCAPLSTTASLSADVLYGLPDQLRQGQGVFTRTGGLHAAGLFTLAGQRLVVREDVGRHNAVDKVVGAALVGGTLVRGTVAEATSADGPLGGSTPHAPLVLLVSGRTSFEIVQKAIAAGVPFVAGVSAPSSLAVSLARESGVTLAGFLRGRRANVYSHPDRILA